MPGGDERAMPMREVFHNTSTEGGKQMTEQKVTLIEPRKSKSARGGKCTERNPAFCRWVCLSLTLAAAATQLCSCLGVPFSHEEAMKSLGAQMTASLPSDFWADAQTLVVEVVPEQASLRVAGLDRIGPVTDDELRQLIARSRLRDEAYFFALLKEELWTNMSPPMGIKSSFHLVPGSAMLSGEVPEPIPADRYLQIAIPVMTLPGSGMFSGSKVKLRAGAICTMFTDKVARAKFLEAHERPQPTPDSGGLSEIWAYYRQLRERKALQGIYVSPALAAESRLFKKEQWLDEDGQFLESQLRPLLRSLAEQVNTQCFGTARKSR